MFVTFKTQSEKLKIIIGRSWSEDTTDVISYHWRVKVNIYVKYHHCLSNGRGIIVQKPLFHRRTDRQTAMVKPVYLHNFVGGGIQTYFQCGEIVER